MSSIVDTINNEEFFFLIMRVVGTLLSACSH